jgi:hypothetical protein
MRIVTSQLSMSASHEKTTTHVRQERLQVWVGTPPGREAPTAPSPQIAAPPAATPDAVDGAPAGEGQLSGDDRQLLDLLLILRAFEKANEAHGRAGDKHVGSHGDGHARRLAHGAHRIREAYAGHKADAGDAPAPPPRAGWGVEYDLREERREVERTQFAAAGKVTTADGRTIEFATAFKQEHTEVQSLEVHLRAGDAVARKVDPLVLNLSGGGASFEGRHQFDLDGDGRREDLARLAGGSAYLARDTDGSGAIESGKELFGPTTGSGFGELGTHDADHNGWIDEADPIWGDLRLWRPDASGPGHLTTLAAEGVGAIAVASLATPFTMKSGGVAEAELAATGVFLKESGGVGTVQHVDLVAAPAVEPEPST